MMDTCLHLIWSNSGDDTWNDPEPAFSEGETYACGYQPSPTGSVGEVQDGSELALADAVLRLPLAASVVSPADRIVITALKGENLTTNLVYSVMSIEARGPSGLVLKLRYEDGISYST